MTRRLFSKIIAGTIFFLASCHSTPGRKNVTVSRGFYYWKSVFRNIADEQNVLKKEKVSKLYIKFFDVDWNYGTHQPFPLARILFADKPDSVLQIIPVVFITNRCLNQLDSSSVPALAARIAALLENICTASDIKNIPETQVDCDWTEKTKNKYFYLLNELHKHAFFSARLLSATIRMYQAKYKQRTGVPPVDKGLLMAYNMGNIRNPSAGNSILDPAELDKYIRDIGSYPLPLDLALPLFGWYVWFNSDQSYKGLIHEYDFVSPDSLPVEHQPGGRFRFVKDYSVAGFSFRKGDILRKEDSSFEDIIKAGELFAKHYTGTDITLSCFHLDSLILKKYPPDVLEKIFNCLGH